MKLNPSKRLVQSGAYPTYTILRFQIHVPCGHLSVAPIDNYSVPVAPAAPSTHKVELFIIDQLANCTVCSAKEEPGHQNVTLNRLLRSLVRSRAYRLDRQRASENLLQADKTTVTSWSLDIAYVRGILDGLQQQHSAPLKDKSIGRHYTEIIEELIQKQNLALAPQVRGKSISSKTGHHDKELVQSIEIQKSEELESISVDLAGVRGECFGRRLYNRGIRASSNMTPDSEPPSPSPNIRDDILRRVSNGGISKTRTMSLKDAHPGKYEHLTIKPMKGLKKGLK